MTSITKAQGRISIRKSGKGFGSLWIYVPSEIVKDETFPFVDKEVVDVELSDGILKVRKNDELFNLINEYGIKNAILSQLLEKKAIENKNRPFLYYEKNTYTLKDINENANQIAHGLLKLKKELKLKRWPTISALLPSCPDFLFCLFGVAKAGCIFSPLNTELENDSLKIILNKSETEILIMDYKYFSKIEETIDALFKIKKILVRNAPKEFKYNDKILNYQEIIAKNSDNPNIQIENWYPMEILYTAGTTGTPKGVLYRNYMVLTGINVGKELVEIGLNQSDVLYCPSPLFHGISLLLTILPAIFYNASIVITEKFDLSTFWKNVFDYKITAIIFFGDILSNLMRQPSSTTDRAHSVKWAFGFGASRDAWEQFENRFGIPIYQGWTLTEAVGITINKEGSKGGKIGSVGRPITGYEFKIVDNQGKVLPPGQKNVGQIVSRSTMPIPLGYYDDTKWKAEKNGWFYTEDYGYTDENGFLYYKGRESDIARLKNEVFFTKKIEKIANSHPKVLESAAFTILSEKENNEDIKLCVVLKENGILTQEEIYNFLKKKLEVFMIPRYIEFKSELPKSITFLVQKFKLKKEWEDRASQKNTWDSKIKDFIK